MIASPPNQRDEPKRGEEFTRGFAEGWLAGSQAFARAWQRG
jgi:hypothetical protein